MVGLVVVVDDVVSRVILIFFVVIAFSHRQIVVYDALAGLFGFRDLHLFGTSLDPRRGVVSEFGFGGRRFPECGDMIS